MKLEAEIVLGRQNEEMENSVANSVLQQQMPQHNMVYTSRPEQVLPKISMLDSLMDRVTYGFTRHPVESQGLINRFQGCLVDPWDVLWIHWTSRTNIGLPFDFLCIGFSNHTYIPAGNCMFKVNNRNTRTRCEICSKLTIKIPERRLASFWCLYC